MKCPKCGFDNLNEANFCIKCGSRMDEKVPCPKCGEYISNDSEFCPKCGKSIPHQKKTHIDHNEKVDVYKAKIARIFNLVSCFVTLFCFIFFIGYAFTNQLSFGSSPDQNSNFATYLVDCFKDINTVNGVEASLRIIRSVIYTFNLAVTIGFSIVGILKCAKSFKHREDINRAYKYLVVVLLAKLTTLSLLVSTYSHTDFVNVSNHFLSFEYFVIFHITLCLAFDCFLSFKRGQVSLFISRIILGFGLYLLILIVVQFRNSDMYLLLDASSTEGMIAHFLHLTEALASHNYVNGFISNYIVSIISLFLALAIISTAYFLGVFLVSSYFRGMNKFKKFRIVFYMAVILLSILATSYLISSIVEYVMYGRYLNESYYYAGNAVAVFVCSALLVGVAIATFNIYNRFSRRNKLSERTTLVE